MQSSQALTSDLLSAQHVIARLRSFDNGVVEKLKNIHQLSQALNCETSFDELSKQFNIPSAQKARFLEGVSNQINITALEITDLFQITTAEIASLACLSSLSNKEGKKKFANIIKIADKLTQDSLQNNQLDLVELLVEINALPNAFIDDLAVVASAKKEKSAIELVRDAHEYLNANNINVELLKVLDKEQVVDSNFIEQIKEFSYQDLDIIKNLFGSPHNLDSSQIYNSIGLIIDGFDLDKCALIYDKASTTLNSKQLTSIKRSSIKYFGEEMWQKHISRAPIGNVRLLYSKGYSSSSFALGLLRFLPHDPSILTTNLKFFVESIERLTTQSHGGERALHGYVYSGGEKAFMAKPIADRMRIFYDSKSNKASFFKVTPIAVEKLYCLLAFVKGISHQNFPSYRDAVMFFGILCKCIMIKKIDLEAGQKITADELIHTYTTHIKSRRQLQISEADRSFMLSSLDILSDLQLIRLTRPNSNSTSLEISLNADLSSIPKSRIRRGWEILGISSAMQEVQKYISEHNSMAQEKSDDPSGKSLDAPQYLAPLKTIYSDIQTINRFCAMLETVPSNQNIRQFITKREKQIRQFVNETVDKEATKKLIVKELSSASSIDDLKNRLVARYSKIAYDALSEYLVFKLSNDSDNPAVQSLTSEINDNLELIKENAKKLQVNKPTVAIEINLTDPTNLSSLLVSSKTIQTLPKQIDFNQFYQTIQQLCQQNKGSLGLLIKQIEDLIELPD